MHINVKHTALVPNCTHKFPTVRKLKGQPVTFLSRHLTTLLQGGRWWTE